MSTSNNWKGGPQKYFIPDRGIEVKVEKINMTRYVAHFPEGAERVGKTDVFKWEHRGQWSEETINECKAMRTMDLA